MSRSKINFVRSGVRVYNASMIHNGNGLVKAPNRSDTMRIATFCNAEVAESADFGLV